jgi:hypothetical protein
LTFSANPTYFLFAQSSMMRQRIIFRSSPLFINVTSLFLKYPIWLLHQLAFAHGEGTSSIKEDRRNMVYQTVLGDMIIKLAWNFRGKLPTVFVAKLPLNECAKSAA